MIYYEAVNGVGDDGIVKSMEGTEAWKSDSVIWIHTDLPWHHPSSTKY